jgi:hypothetical protein
MMTPAHEKAPERKMLTRYGRLSIVAGEPPEISVEPRTPCIKGARERTKKGFHADEVFERQMFCNRKKGDDFDSVLKQTNKEIVARAFILEPTEEALKSIASTRHTSGK